MLMGTRGVFKLGTIGGIAIKAHWSWALVLLLITFDLAAGYFPKKMPGEGDLTYWALGLVAALMLFVSVLLHELSHSFMARARGLKVRDIVLFIFGGVSNIETEPERARDEFAITVVGPLTSFVLAGVFFGLAALIPADGGALGAVRAGDLPVPGLHQLPAGAVQHDPRLPAGRRARAALDHLGASRATSSGDAGGGHGGASWWPTGLSSWGCTSRSS